MSDGQLRSGRRLAFDYGDVRTGVAVSDFHAIICSPQSVLLTQSPDFALQIKSLLLEIEPVYIAVGEPRHLSGAESAKMDSVESFHQLLAELTDLPIYRIDERMSTVAAQARLHAGGKNTKESRATIDAVAACIILESALAREKSGNLS